MADDPTKLEPTADDTQSPAIPPTVDGIDPEDGDELPQAGDTRSLPIIPGGDSKLPEIGTPNILPPVPRGS
ncbi:MULTISPECIES: hypothetical protein [Streptomyces]|nr:MULTISPECIES: hypothetical protein [Streptomyces]